MALQAIQGFCAGYYNSRAPGVSACRTVNMRVEQNEDPNSKSPATLFPVSGKRLFTTLSGPIIGAWSNRYRTFWVAKNATGSANVYEVFEDGTNKLYGQVAFGGNPATMRSNGGQLLICSAGNVYLATGTAIYQPLVNYTSGFANVNGHIVTWLSSPADNSMFTEVQPGDLMLFPPSVMGPTSAAPFVHTVGSVDSPTQITLVDDAGILANYAYQLGAGPDVHGVSSLLSGVMVEYIDGYFIVNVPNSITFRISHLFDGGTWDALDFQSKSGSVDDIAAILAYSGYLALVGDTNSVEIWGDSGNAQFPFARVSGMSLNVGTEAPWSIARLTNGGAIWLMESSNGGRQFMLSMGGAPRRISNHALEFALRKYAKVNDAIASTYIEAGHEYYRVDFPAANRTWEYDVTSNVWVELGVLTPDDEVYGCDSGRYRVHVTWPSGAAMDLVGDFQSGNIYQVAPEFQDDNGAEIPVMRIAPHLNTALERMSAPAFALDCELGTIDPSLVGPDGNALIPTVTLAYSDDGARTWRDAGAASLGRSGEYEGTYLTLAEQSDLTPGSQTKPQVFEARPLWSGLGSFWISRTYKIKSTAKMLRAVYNGLAEVSK
jgi:hypothetical protein